MIKSIVALTLSSICVMACTQTPPAQSGTAGQAVSPAQSDGSKSASAAAAPESTAPAPAPPPATPEPAPPPAPAFREVTIPAGTSLSVKLLNTLASNKSQVEDPIKGSLAKAVTISGETALPAGTQLLGSVTEAAESGRVKGKASVAFRFDRLVVDDETVRVQTATVHREAAGDTKSDVKKGGLGAGAGAIVGGQQRLVLDSPPPTVDVSRLMAVEGRFQLTDQQGHEHYEHLIDQARHQIAKRVALYQELASQGRTAAGPPARGT